MVKAVPDLVSIPPNFPKPAAPHLNVIKRAGADTKRQHGGGRLLFAEFHCTLARKGCNRLMQLLPCRHTLAKRP